MTTVRPRCLNVLRALRRDFLCDMPIGHAGEHRSGRDSVTWVDGHPLSRSPSDLSQTSTNPDVVPHPPRSAPTAPSTERANGSTCGFCGDSTDAWPAKDCEDPQEHATAVFDCGCGDTVTVADVQASPKKHRRCHLIGARG